jgi:hypothetical protein
MDLRILRTELKKLERAIKAADEMMDRSLLDQTQERRTAIVRLATHLALGSIEPYLGELAALTHSVVT